MDEEGRWAQIAELDDQLLIGCVVISEWCSFISREAETAYAKGAFLAAILTAVSGIETYLRSEYSTTGKECLFELIDGSPISVDLKDHLHKLRKYRNKWVHVDSPWDDRLPLQKTDEIEMELEQMSFFAVSCLLQTLYENQGV
ncbi:MAG TPA: hypothetical protein PLB91_01180 [Spirochaetales bacterium]|nr:hypothetical protein [Spirochaetales bacterium]